MIPNEDDIFDVIPSDDVDGEPKTKYEEKEEDEEDGQDPEIWKLKTDKNHGKNKLLYLDGWVYRGEGNANLVIALPPCERKVLRFRKSSLTSEASPDGGRARTTREIEFLKYVISGLLGGYVEPPEPLRVTREEMIKVSEVIHHLRPEHRRCKKIVEDYATIFNDYAFLPKNLTAYLRNAVLRRPTFCVEIKPKQGFRHEFDVQFKKCTYCLTQYYKLKTGAIKSRSNYCPYDLFSGDNERMKKSIQGLLESPQNNLKIFRDGVVVYDHKNELREVENVFDEWFSNVNYLTMDKKYEKFYELVIISLLREFTATSKYIGRKASDDKIDTELLSTYDLQLQPQRIDQSIVSRAKEILYFDPDDCNFARNHDIPRCSVLGKLLDMQQLPYHSSDFVYNVYSNHFHTLNDEKVYFQMIKTHRGEDKVSFSNEKKKAYGDDLEAPKSANSSSNMTKSKPRISDSNGNENHKFTDSVLCSVATNASLDFRNNNNFQRNESKEEMKTWITMKEMEVLQNYLLVTTAKDCSILIAFQEIDSVDAADIPAEFIIREKEGANFLVNIGVSDLDPKSIHCIEKHRQRDTNVLLSLIEILEKELDFRNEIAFDMG